MPRGGATWSRVSRRRWRSCRTAAFRLDYTHVQTRRNPRPPNPKGEYFYGFFQTLYQRAPMSCDSCTKLLAAYKHAVSLYTSSASEITTLAGDDFKLSYPK